MRIPLQFDIIALRLAISLPVLPPRLTIAPRALRWPETPIVAGTLRVPSVSAALRHTERAYYIIAIHHKDSLR